MGTYTSKKRIATIKAHEDSITMVSAGLAKTVEFDRTSFEWEVQELLAGVAPDVVLLDLVLPIGFGANLLRIVRETLPGISVIGRVEIGLIDPKFFSIEGTDNGVSLQPVDGVHLEGIV